MGKNRTLNQSIELLSKYEYLLEFEILEVRKLNKLCFWCRSNCEGPWNYNWNPDYIPLKDHHIYDIHLCLEMPFDRVEFSFYYKEDRDCFALIWKGEA